MIPRRSISWPMAKPWEDVGLGDARQVLGGALGRGLPVAAPVEGPGAAERAVPRTAARELGRGARVEHADEVAPPVARQVAGGRKPVEVFQHRGGRAGARAGHHTRHRVEARVAQRFEHARRGDLALAAHDAVERAGRVLEQLPGDERRAVAAGEDEGLRPPAARGHGQVEHLGDVGQVVQREADRARLEGVQLTDVVLVAEDLEVEEAHLVAGGAQRLGHALEPERLQLQIHLRVHEWTRMDEQNAHQSISRAKFGGLGGPFVAPHAISPAAPA